MLNEYLSLVASRWSFLGVSLSRPKVLATLPSKISHSKGSWNVMSLLEEGEGRRDEKEETGPHSPGLYSSTYRAGDTQGIKEV